MALFKNDVSEYVTPGRLDPARLVVTIRPDERDPDRHDVTARVDDDSVVATGSFVVSPEWRLQGARPTTSKVYPAEPNRAKIGAQLFSALFSGALSRCWAQAVERGRERFQAGVEQGVVQADRSVAEHIRKGSPHGGHQHQQQSE